MASAGNDHRLDASEAPPAIVSIFLGDELSAILKAIENDTVYEGTARKTIKLGVDTIPEFSRDSTDRNRTSPFAFTGNKLEFRMVGASDSIACANIMLNAAVADTLRILADELEKSGHFEETLHSLLRDTITAHRRILFNGNGYDEAWVKEASQKRGLLNLRTTVDCIPYLLHDKNVSMLKRMKVFREKELRSRHDIILENYVKCVSIEANTMLDMVNRDILPSLCTMMGELSNLVNGKKAATPDASCRYETATIKKLSALCDAIDLLCGSLESHLCKLEEFGSFQGACIVRDKLLPTMEALRGKCDEAEELYPDRLLPFPLYEDLLFTVK